MSRVEFITDSFFPSKLDEFLELNGFLPTISDKFYNLMNGDDEANWTLDLPGGKRHLAETAWAAARREITEEALVEIAATATPRATVALGDKDMRCFVVDAATV